MARKSGSIRPWQERCSITRSRSRPPRRRSDCPLACIPAASDRTEGVRTMNRYALIYGAIAGAIAATVLTVGIASDLSNHTTSLWFGYLVMLVALSLIFVGVKRYRDVECGGVIRFGRAFGLGLAIAAVAGVIYALVWESYLQISGYDFMADYTRSVLDGMRAEGAAPA